MRAVKAARVVCGGLARFDGETLDRFLPGQCISMDIAADGSVWVLADEDLVAGSGIDFDPKGQHRLKGIPEAWRRYAART